MAKTKKIKKSNEENDNPKDESVKVDGEEETEKESGTLSDGVLDAFDEVTPIDPMLLDDEESIPEEEDDDELDSGDYRPNDEW